MILLDTMALIWLVNGKPRLGRRARARIEGAAGDVGFSVISLYEIGMLVSKRRIELRSSLAAWRRELIRNGIAEKPLSGTVAVLATRLDGLPNDPADRLIAATAIAVDATLITSDEIILDWPGELKRLDARK